MKDIDQQDVPSVTPQIAPVTPSAISPDPLQKDADDMADRANESEQTFDSEHGIFDKI